MGVAHGRVGASRAGGAAGAGADAIFMVLHQLDDDEYNHGGHDGGDCDRRQVFRDELKHG